MTKTSSIVPPYVAASGTLMRFAAELLLGRFRTFLGGNRVSARCRPAKALAATTSACASRLLPKTLFISVPPDFWGALGSLTPEQHVIDGFG
jgi:hypothetical protein